MEPCKHRRIWIIGNGNASLLWCYQCGAIRHNAPGERWVKPTGKNGINPAMTSKGRLQSRQVI